MTINRPKASFNQPGISKQIANLRYEHHLKLIHEALKSVYQLRQAMSIYFYALIINLDLDKTNDSLSQGENSKKSLSHWKDQPSKS